MKKTKNFIACMAVLFIVTFSALAFVSTKAGAATLGRLLDVIGALDDVAISHDITKDNLRFTVEALDGDLLVAAFPVDDGQSSPVISSLKVYNDGGFEEYPVNDIEFDLNIPLVDATHIQGNEVVWEYRIELEDGTYISTDGNFVFDFGGGGGPSFGPAGGLGSGGLGSGGFGQGSGF